MRWSAAGSLALGALVACSSFGSTEPAAGAPPGALPNDAGMFDAEAGQSVSFCEAHQPAIFCDDFEQPNRSVTTAAPWDVIDGDANGVFSLASGFESPAALRVSGTLQPSSQLLFKKALPLDTTRLRWTFRFRLVHLDSVAGGQAQILVVGFAFADNHRFDYTLYDDGTQGLASSNLGDNDFLQGFDAPPIGIRKDTWEAMTIELEPIDGQFELRLFVGTTQLSKVRVPSGTSPALVMGGGGRGEGAVIDMDIDDVLVTTF